MRTRHFLLLELLIGCFLLAFAVAPVLRLYTVGYLQTLEAVRFHKQAHWIHRLYAEVVEKLYLQQIPWQELVVAEKRLIFPSVSGEELAGLGFEVSYRFRELEQKKRNERRGYIFEVEFIVEDKKKATLPVHYRYPFYVDRGLRL